MSLPRKENILFALFFISCILHTHVGISDCDENYDNAFIQIDSDIKIVMTDDESENLFGSQTFGSLADNGIITILESPIILEPNEIDFGQKPLGISMLRQVRIFNRNMESSIQMLSISGNSDHFHCSFFTDRLVPPSGNTTFDVLFLGRKVESVENVLYVHTSAGSFPLRVSAVITENPYRLRPLLGVRLPLNATFSPLVSLHNPYDMDIQILEVSSLDSDIRLDLSVQNSVEKNEKIWLIPPFQTKPIFKAIFLAHRVSNRTSYICIKLKSTELQYIYLPLQVEVSSKPGLYSPLTELDFGILSTIYDTESNPIASANQRSLKVLMYGSGPTWSLTTLSVSVIPFTSEISVKEFRSNWSMMNFIASNGTNIIAEITFKSTAITRPGLHRALVVIEGRSKRNRLHRLSIPLHAEVLRGSLIIAPNVTTHFRFVSSGYDSYRAFNPELTNPLQNISVINQFDTPIVIYGVTLDSDITNSTFLDFFEFILPTRALPVLLKPAESYTIAVLKLRTDEVSPFVHFTAFILILTNASSFQIPIICFDGTLIPKLLTGDPNQNVIQFGLLGHSEDIRRDFKFVLVNPNDINVRLLRWNVTVVSSNMKTTLIMKGVTKHFNEEEEELDGVPKMLNNHTLSIGPNRGGAIFLLRLETKTAKLASFKAGLGAGFVFVDSEFESLTIPFIYRIANRGGSLSFRPSRLIFDPIFPGEKVALNFSIRSSFEEDMIIERIWADWPFKKAITFFPALPLSKLILKGGGKRTYIGKLTLEIRSLCTTAQEDECYCGFPITSQIGSDWFNGLALLTDVGVTDLELIKTLRQRYHVASSVSDKITLRLDTVEGVRGFPFKAQLSFVWPMLVGRSKRNNSKVVFPFTQVGNFSTLHFTLTNPSASLRLFVHLVTLQSYPKGQALKYKLEKWLLHDNLSNTADYDVDVVDNYSMSFVSVRDTSSNNSAVINGLGDTVEAVLGVGLDPNTKAFILRPKQSVNVSLLFRPLEEKLFKTAVFIRNNMTGIEILEVEGRGGHGVLKFGKYKIGVSGFMCQKDDIGDSAWPKIEVDINVKHLRNCGRPRSGSNYSPLLTVKRAFKAKNMGQLPIWVGHFSISDLPCEGYGFKVLNCHGFLLGPLESLNIDIAFTPDFTLSKVVRNLSFSVFIGPKMTKINFILQATIPPHMLALCAASLPRPEWEKYIYYGLNALMLVIAFFVLIAGVGESMHLLKRNFVVQCVDVTRCNEKLLDNPVIDQEKYCSQRKHSIKCVNGVDSDSLCCTRFRGGVKEGNRQSTNFFHNQTKQNGSANDVFRPLSTNREISEEKRRKQLWVRKDMIKIRRQNEHRSYQDGIIFWFFNVFADCVNMIYVRCRNVLSRLTCAAIMTRLYSRQQDTGSICHKEKLLKLTSVSLEQSSAEGITTTAAVAQLQPNKKQIVEIDKCRNKSSRNEAKKKKAIGRNRKHSVDTDIKSDARAAQSSFEPLGSNISRSSPSPSSINNVVETNSFSGLEDDISEDSASSSLILSNSNYDFDNSFDTLLNTSSPLVSSSLVGESVKKNAGKSRGKKKKESLANSNENAFLKTPIISSNKVAPKKTDIKNSVESVKQPVINKVPILATLPKKATPVGKILPEPKRPENLGAKFGPVGTGKPLWPVNNAVDECWRTSSPKIDSFDRMMQNCRRSSLIRSLHAERRERMEGYMRHGRRNEDWPGFGRDISTNFDVFDLWDQPRHEGNCPSSARPWNNQTSHIWPSQLASARSIHNEFENTLNSPLVNARFGGLGIQLVSPVNNEDVGFNPMTSASIWSNDDRHFPPIIRANNKNSEVERHSLKSEKTWSNCLFQKNNI